MCEICSKLTTKTLKRRRSGVILLDVSILGFEQVNTGWIMNKILEMNFAETSVGEICSGSSCKSKES